MKALSDRRRPAAPLPSHDLDGLKHARPSFSSPSALSKGLLPYNPKTMTDPNPVARRRTFAIISHPDAGKTTLTEKLLLFGGAIQLAGEVRAKANRRQTRSDWMGIERDRGISVVTSVMTFEYGDCVFNLLDTPGHEDFSEDTYRTLTAVDSAVMVIDAAKGIEARTRKLFEVCRLRDIPIVTFINKMDRETRDPFDLLDEIEKTLALDSAPLTWTIGRGRSLAGAYDIRRSRLTPLGKDAQTFAVNGPDDPRVAELLPEHERAQAIEELNLAVEGLKAFDKEAFLEGHMTPVLWGSALKDFGVKDLIDALAEFAPSPRAQEAQSRTVQADEPKMTGFVFKIQANMDPNHRDRIAFMRVCSGKLQRGMRAKLVRTGKPITLSAPQFFFAQDRSLAEEAFAGDVVGIPNHGLLRIGDTLSEGEQIVFRGVPSFAPEILRRVKLADAMKAKKLREALQQMAEEGVVQVFLPHDGAAAIVGVVGALQLDVLTERLNAEYGLPVTFEPSRFEICRWVSSSDKTEMGKFLDAYPSSIASDLDGAPVFMASSAFNLRYEQERWPKVTFTDIKDYQKAAT
jgi:peptide chain release factor 3